MATQVITTPVLTDLTGKDIVEGLTGIKNAVQPINIYLDVQMSIPVSGWSASSPHTYNWLYNRITEECGIEVYFTEGAEDVNMKYLEYDKIAGGIRFEIEEIPDKAIPLMVRIINAQTSAVVDPVDDTLIASDAVPQTSNVHEALVNHEGRLSDTEDSIERIDDELENVGDELSLRLKSVNGVPGDENGDVVVNETEYTHQIVTDDAQQDTGEFLFRTTGGDASLTDGPAKLVSISGRSIHTGEAVEELNMTIHAATRPTPEAITATIDNDTFEAYVETAGVYSIVYSSAWSEDPALYGITVSGTPVEGDMISVSWDEVSDPVMTVYAPRTPAPAITATLDEAVFKSYVGASGTYTLSYTTDWSADPALYGVTVTNDPINGDSIVIVYVQSNRGTITVSNPTKFVSTGWNLYDNSTGKKYARVKKYSTTYGFLVGGSYASLEFSETLSGSKTAITPASGYFTIPSDGYVWVTGGDDTTYIMMTWSDWTEGYEGDFKTYEESVVNLAPIMTNFSNGLMQVGAVADEINFSMMRAISRIERLAYTEQNLAYAEASGRAYDADTNYIYLVKETEDVYVITETGAYTACDHGLEIVDGDVPVNVSTLYGRNLVDYLRHDIPEQLDKHSQAIIKDEEGIAYRLGNTNTTGAALAKGTYIRVAGNTNGVADGVYKVTDSNGIAASGSLTTSNLGTVTGGIANEINSNKQNKRNIYKMTGTKTTSANGNIELALSYADNYILSASRDGVEGLAIPYNYNANGHWGIHFCTDIASMEPLGSMSISYTVVYISRSELTSA